MRLGMLFAVLAMCFGQNVETPRFDRDHILAHRSRRPSTLTRGQFVSIYGWNLSPKPWCGKERNQPEPYPPELCGVRVLLGDRPAGLMYVGPLGNTNMRGDQINFQVPDNAPGSGEIPIRVCVGSNCSEPVRVAFTVQDIILRVKERLYTKMPVWVGVEIPMNAGFKYPLNFCPWDFGGYEFEIRQNGHLDAAIAKPPCQSSQGGWLFLSRDPEVPLHLVHNFDEPGTYEIRLHGPILNPEGSKVIRVGYSEWTLISISAEPEPMRAAWLAGMQQSAGNVSQGRQDERLIVSLLAWPDEAALTALDRFLPPLPFTSSSPRGLSGNLNVDSRCIALNALAAFPEPLVEKVIPAERLNGMLQWKGICR